MIQRPSKIGLVLLFAWFAPALLRAEEPVLSKEAREAKALADKIDQMIAARWAEKGIKPASAADDGEFLRRAYLDLVGRIPRVAEFLDAREDRRGDWRARWIDQRLLKSEEYVSHFAATWRHLIVPADNNQMGQFFGNTIEGWLQQKFRENAHYDQMARELIASPFGQNQVTATFFQANQLKPENLAASTSRLFLGVKLECAQCHDHPFARWTRKQFWEYAAFFSGIDQGSVLPNGQQPALRESSERREISIPGTDKKVQARFLDGNEPKWKADVGTRMILADWLLTSDNPFFARAAANRLWAHFFGIGLVEPVDDLSDQNPASHPELLDELARQFASHDFDVKFLIRAITFSKTYQLSSAWSQPSQSEDPRLFTRMSLKGLSGEQLYDSLQVAMSAPLQAQVMPNQPFVPNSPRAEFLAKFVRQDRRTEHETSILQALTLMNGKLMAEATSLESCKTLKNCAEEPLPTAQRVEALYLAVFARKPRPDELERFVKYVDSGGPKKDPKAALADVFWALLNSAEFLLNH